MRNAMIALATLLVGVSLGLPSFAAAWATPGAACTQEGANANSDGFLTCTGGVWVSNAVLLGTTSATCDSTKAGYIRYTGGQFEGCNGTGWIQLASSKLKVYKADGVTVLGNYIGMNGDPGDKCENIVYTDDSGNISTLSYGDCKVFTASSYSAYFNNVNCTGAVATNYPNVGVWGCTGSGTCTSNLLISGTTSYTNFYYYSWRSMLGGCTNATSNLTTYYNTSPHTPKCGTAACLVK